MGGLLDRPPQVHPLYGKILHKACQGLCGKSCGGYLLKICDEFVTSLQQGELQKGTYIVLKGNLQELRMTLTKLSEALTSLVEDSGKILWKGLVEETPLYPL